MKGGIGRSHLATYQNTKFAANIIWGYTRSMKKTLILGFVLIAFPAFVFAAGDYKPETVGAGNPEVHIKSDGNITIKSGHIDQIAGSTFYLGITWGAMPIRFTMKTDARTLVTKRYGGNTTVSQVKLGDYIDVDGEFFVGSDFFGVNAQKIKDWSLQEEAGTYSGVILEINPEERFTLRTLDQKTLSVRLSTSSAVSIKKGSVIVPFGRLKKGDAVLSVSGVYNYADNLLTADKLVVYQAKTNFIPRNFEGTLRQIMSPTFPAIFIVTVSGVDYTVNVNEKTAVLKKNKSVGQLARFVAGDTIRFYGAVREEEKTLQDALVVDAEVVRNLNL